MKAPRWLLLAPMGLGLLGYTVSTLTTGRCEGLCGRVTESLDWAGIIFPNIPAFWLSLYLPPDLPLEPWVDVALAFSLAGLWFWAAWRWLPPRLSAVQFGGVCLAWALLSLVTFWMTPWVLVARFH